MRKIIFTILIVVFTPFYTFAQAGGAGMLGTLSWLGMIIVIGISILIFLLLREVWAWYTKTNQIIKILENQTELLKKILNAIQENKNE